jgi:hypothetical protein
MVRERRAAIAVAPRGSPPKAVNPQIELDAANSAYGTGSHELTRLPHPFRLRRSLHGRGGPRRTIFARWGGLLPRSITPERPMPFRIVASQNTGRKTLPHCAAFAQDLQFSARTPTIRIRNRPAKQVGDQRWLNLHSTNRGSTRQSVLCAVSASPECLINRGELHRLRTGSPAHCSRPSGPDSTSFFRISHSPWRRQGKRTMIFDVKVGPE